VNDAIDASVSQMKYLDNLQPGEAHLMELDDRSLRRIGTFYGIQKKLARFVSTSLYVIRSTPRLPEGGWHQIKQGLLK
jgi:hypothetical protein